MGFPASQLGANLGAEVSFQSELDVFNISCRRVKGRKRARRQLNQLQSIFIKLKYDGSRSGFGRGVHQFARSGDGRFGDLVQADLVRQSRLEAQFAAKQPIRVDRIRSDQGRQRQELTREGHAQAIRILNTMRRGLRPCDGVAGIHHKFDRRLIKLTLECQLFLLFSQRDAFDLWLWREGFVAGINVHRFLSAKMHETNHGNVQVIVNVLIGRGNQHTNVSLEGSFPRRGLELFEDCVFNCLVLGEVGADISQVQPHTALSYRFQECCTRGGRRLAARRRDSAV
ncbi:hypothetical protein AUC68_14735 [Methyloceanibacter methanicus]|uniref:Uncharacterized protein n=1 Tax=Methyloceanibacter methanicus TaxID=1774968 RepID=A0A1E3W3Z9_9HYPH|nr:hypothetical protein AUC68_14735 [Methyloceanibacter methanicus]